MPKDAYVLRRFTDAGTGLHHPKGSVIEKMDQGRFDGLSGTMVRKATAAEVAAARAEGAAGPSAAPPSHPRGLVAPPPPPAPPKRVRKPATKAKRKPRGK